MENKTVRALSVNGSPRKNKHTVRLLARAAEGAAARRAQVETVHRHDLGGRRAGSRTNE